MYAVRHSAKFKNVKLGLESKAHADGLSHVAPRFSLCPKVQCTFNHVTTLQV